MTIWALFLPKVKHSLYFHRNKESTVNSEFDQSVGVTINENTGVSMNIILYLKKR